MEDKDEIKKKSINKLFKNYDYDYYIIRMKTRNEIKEKLGDKFYRNENYGSEFLDKEIIDYKLDNNLKSNILDYKVSEIWYALNENCIQNLQIIYKNRKDGSIKIQDTRNIYLPENNYIDYHEIKIPDYQEIHLIKKITGKNRDIGFNIKFGQKSYLIGYKSYCLFFLKKMLKLKNLRIRFY